MSSVSTIRLRNIRVHNLKNIDLDIPHGQWLAVCGLSGSGKSSLAFDTLYAEGQRRYLESLSPATRQFIVQLDKPAADRIDGIPPAISVQAVRGKPDRRSTVGSATEIVEYLRLLFAGVGQPVCLRCDVPVQSDHPQSVSEQLNQMQVGRKFMVAFPIQKRNQTISAILEEAKQNGFLRAIVGQQLVPLDSNTRFDFAEKEPVSIVVDRLTCGSGNVIRIRESLETAFQYGDGQAEVWLVVDYPTTNSSIGKRRQLGQQWFGVIVFSTELMCANCSLTIPPASPKQFSYSYVLGACSSCDGIGFVDLDMSQLCPECHGDRLGTEALSYKINQKTIADLCRLEISELTLFLQSISFSDGKEFIADPLIVQILSRLNYLQQVGLGYLNLNRSMRSVSSGETQRLALTSCLSSTLVNLLYVLDEPSLGMHAHDIPSLLESMRQLHRRGNTLVTVDHQPEVIRAASRIIELGPQAGSAAGEIVFDGTISELEASVGSVTGDYLGGRRGLSCGQESRRTGQGRLRLLGASGNNLKQVDVDFPLRCLCVVTGVSGAGKSTLVQHTLLGAVERGLGKAEALALPYDSLFGVDQIDEVVWVDQNPIGRSPRSNPVTYVKAFTDIRTLFAETPDAKSHNLTAGHFSFNVAGGRCDKCNGDGQLSIDMQFLPDVSIQCDQCVGTRYRDLTLAARYRGLNIAEVLNMTVRDSFSFFRGQPKIQGKLKSLIDVGLEYIRLGQPATTLSAGEAQRLKLASYLNAASNRRVLFLLAEPTSGLHMADVNKLLDCFVALISVGHSFVIIEHHMQLIKQADWIVDLGPGAAGQGGNVVVCGTPEQVAKHPQSLTGRYLSPELKKSDL